LRGDGTFWFPLASESDIDNCVKAYAALDASEKPGVRAWIIQRVILLGGNAVERLPKGWAEPKIKLHPNELGPTGPVGGRGPAGSGGSTGGGTAI